MVAGHLDGRAAAGTTRRSRPYGPLHAGPRRRGAALRAGDLRGPQGLPARRRLGLDLPARGQRAPGSQRSARRLALPELPEEDFVESLRALVAADEAWVPAGDGGEASLYLRPFMFASEAFLGRAPGAPRSPSASSPRRPARTSPAGVKPVSIWLSHGLHPRRAGRHRRGQVRRQLRRQPGRRRSRPPRNGCDQVVLPRRGRAPLGRGARRHEPLLRASTTAASSRPELTGTILEGVTRDLDPRAGRGARATRSRSAGSPSTSGATGVGVRRHHRGLRLRHRRRRHARSGGWLGRTARS